MERTRFPVYEKYKDSGVEWFGPIPQTWESRKTKYLFRLVTSPAPVGNNEELLSVYTDIGVKPRKELEARGNKASTTDHYWQVEKGDIIVNKLLAWMGAVGLSAYDGVTSPAYDVLRKKTKLVPRFYNYLFRNKIAHQEFKRHSRGIMEMRLRLYFDQFGQIFLPYPPEHEQTTIADFLDHKTTLINDFIARKEQLITLLQEQKRVIINQAVTRGIDPDVRLKPSGVDWLGDIPEHWEVKKLKFLATITTGDKDTVDKVPDGKYPFYVRSQIVEKINSYSFDGEAVLTAGDGAGVAKVFHYVNGKFDFHQRVYKFSDFKKMSGKFFYLYMRSNLYKEVLKLSAKSTVDSLRRPMFQNFIMTIPPSKEQRIILVYIENKTKTINAAITKANQEITLIKEYREALIAEAVTGKIDVRSWRQQREKAA